MGSLEELQRRLSQKKETFSEREREPELSPAPSSGPRSWGGKPDPALIQSMLRDKQRKKMRIAFLVTILIGVLALVGGAVAFLFLDDRISITNDDVVLAINAPTNISVGEQVVFTVHYQNRSSIPLESVDIIIEYPVGARPLVGEPPSRGPFRERVSVGRLLPGQEGNYMFRAILFGKDGDTLKTQVTLEYRPENSSARLGKDVDWRMVIERSPIGVAIEMPGDATRGQEVEVTFHYVSSAGAVLENVSLDVLYPSGFTFRSASPPPTRDTNFWRLGDIESGGSGDIRIRGIMEGNPQEEKYFDVRVGLFEENTGTWGLYGQAARSLIMRDALLAVALQAAGTRMFSIAPGKSIPFTITWKNNLPVSVRNVIVEAEIMGTVVDYARIRSQSGSYDGANKKIIWNPSSEEQFRFLGSGDTGVLTFDVPVLSLVPVRAREDKNFEVTAHVRMYTDTVPEGFLGVDIAGNDSLSIKIVSQSGFVAHALYRGGIIQNSGPLPPRVGQETTYTISWSLTSSTNDLENAVVRAVLPSYVRWKNVISPSGEKVSYDSATGEVIWDAGVIVAGTGYTRPARDVAFQVGLAPGVNQIGQSPVLVKDIRMSAKDTFTSTSLTAQSPELTTALRNDLKVTSNEYQVIE